MKQIDLKLKDGEFTNPLRNSLHFPEQAFEIFRSLKDHASETLLVIYLKHDLTGFYDVHSTGCSIYTMLDQHELFGRAYMTKARYMILVHNHPSGDPTPSPQDLENLETIRAFAAPLDKRRLLGLLDFIIVGDDTYWSWAEDKGLKGYEGLL